MPIFNNKNKNEDIDDNTISTDEIIETLSNERVTINPEYLKTQVKKIIEVYLSSIYSGNELTLPNSSMTNEFYNLTYTTIIREKKNGMKRSLYGLVVKDIKPTKMDDSLIYAVNSIEFEVSFTIKFSIFHSTFSQSEEKEFKIKYLFTNGSNYKNKTNWLLEKEVSRKEISSKKLDVNNMVPKTYNQQPMQPTQQPYVQPIPQYPQQGLNRAQYPQQAYNNQPYPQQPYMQPQQPIQPTQQTYNQPIRQPMPQYPQQGFNGLQYPQQQAYGTQPTQYQQKPYNQQMSPYPQQGFNRAQYPQQAYNNQPYPQQPYMQPQQPIQPTQQTYNQPIRQPMPQYPQQGFNGLQYPQQQAYGTQPTQYQQQNIPIANDINQGSQIANIDDNNQTNTNEESKDLMEQKENRKNITHPDRKSKKKEKESDNMVENKNDSSMDVEVESSSSNKNNNTDINEIVVNDEKDNANEIINENSENNDNIKKDIINNEELSNNENKDIENITNLNNENSLSSLNIEDINESKEEVSIIVKEPVEDVVIDKNNDNIDNTYNELSEKKKEDIKIAQRKNRRKSDDELLMEATDDIDM